VVTSETAVRDHRRDLVGLAYRLLGTVSEAEDAVQEAYLRLERHGLEGIDNVGGWLNRTTSRICLDRLTSARARREVYVGPWLPEPLLHDEEGPVERAELVESVTMAFLVVLESLSPAERVAFVLHDVFGYDHAELAVVLDRTEAACRQLVSRARRHVRARRPRFEPDAAARAEVADRFLEACRSGDLDALLGTLAPDVVLRSDGGGVVTAARRPVEGAEQVGRFFGGLLRQTTEDVVVEARPCNGSTGVVVTLGGEVLVVFVPDVADGAVHTISAIRNPAKLARLAVEPR
jgi:RNA polymerase sigma-70 factor, ECF subfamily